MRKPAAALLVLSLAVLALALVPAAGLAAKGGGGGKPSGGSSSLSLVVLSSPYDDGLPHHGGQVTFTVSTTATDRPFVGLNCYQGGVWVYSDGVGIFPSYPWPQDLILASGTWTSGAGDCTATLYYVTSGGRERTLATMSFHVYA